MLSDEKYDSGALLLNFDELIHHNPEIKKERLAQMHALVRNEGLDAFYNCMDEFGIGREIYLHETELQQIAVSDSRDTADVADEKNEIPVQLSRSSGLFHRITAHTDVREKDRSEMTVIENQGFTSWEGTVSNRPVLTFMPRSVSGLKNLVTWANTEKMRLRACGYRHSSSDVFSENGQSLVSMVNVQTATKLPAKYPKMDPENDLEGIQLMGRPYQKNGLTKIKCKIGAATCNYHFQDWVHDPAGGNFNWALPLNVIMTEISFGGSNAMICHGAGIKNPTISDLIQEISFINVRGREQTITDKALLRAAAGSFGLMGPVTSLTFELDAMTYASFKTVQKKPLALTIPPPVGNSLPAHVLKNLSSENRALLDSKKDLDEAFQHFVDCCENYYYAEWFWFPLQDQCWINCWNNDGDPAKSVRYPGASDTSIQRAMSYLAYLADECLGDHTPSVVKKIQTKLMGSLAMWLLPDKKDIVCTMEDALHFRSGIQNFKTRMMEMQIPVPDLPDTGNADWSVCQKAWWAVLDVFYTAENMKSFPMRTTLEMRIMGGTQNIHMASQHGNQRTCCIEVLTPVAVDEKVWDKFLQQVLDKWSELRDCHGRYLNIRPHWAKRFDGLMITRDPSWLDEWDDAQKAVLQKYVSKGSASISVPMRVYMKEIAYKEQIPEFVRKLEIICKKGGYTLTDMQRRFSNPFFDDIIYDHADVVSVKRVPGRFGKYPLFSSSGRHSDQSCCAGVTSLFKRRLG